MNAQRGGPINTGFALLLVALSLLFCYTPAMGQGGVSVGATGNYEYVPPEARFRDWGTAKWSAENTMLQSAYTGLRVIAAKQTIECMKLEHCYETGLLPNALYGNRLSEAEIWRFTGLMSLAAWALSYYAFDPPLRTTWQYVMIGVGLHDIHGNRMEKLQPDWDPLWASLAVGLTVQWTFF
jgi:hypothetical protein